MFTLPSVENRPPVVALTTTSPPVPLPMLSLTPVRPLTLIDVLPSLMMPLPFATAMRDGAADGIARASGQVAGRQRAAAAGDRGEHQIVHVDRDAAIDRQADRAAGAVGAGRALDPAAVTADAVGGHT